MKFIRISFIWFLLGLSDSTKVPSNVIELNENFLEHKDAGKTYFIVVDAEVINGSTVVLLLLLRKLACGGLSKN